ncbi:HAMP domain-containing protein [Nonomuraea sp. KM90]|uniref:HAMP domain-containing protein n=1 Tax=Nonomuraea sp. KM90 TaxID=3457428 RepID=UPI003FCECBEE
MVAQLDSPYTHGSIHPADLRPLLVALRGLRDGNFRTRLELPDDPLLAELATTFNQVIDRNEHLSNELTRLRTEVARRGRLDERLSPSPGTGSWAVNVAAVNTLIDALVIPAAKATRVLNAVADGDLSKRVDLQEDDRPLRGGLRLMGKAVNRMVEQLALFSGEVTRVAREVGTEGRLGGRAKVQGMSGSWRDVTEAVNAMAGRLTAQVRDIAVVTTAVARGDLTRQVTVEATGELLELKLTVNTMVDQLSAFASEVTRVAREVGTEGQLGGRAEVKGVLGTWKDLTDNVNFMASNLTTQVRSIAQVTTAVANGDLSKKITVDARGEILQLKDTINTMVGQLSAFADEVTRVAREVGTEGRLGGQAQVRGVSGVWKDLTDNVNFMASNLTSQVRSIAMVTTAIANGDLSKKITVDARGEILQLKDTINATVDKLSAFADEVTRVAREVGTEGRLGGQAQVRGVSGVWKDLTDNVNFMASNLTSQVRNIAQVATAVANGDLYKKIDVDARGEILELKTTINTMVDTLSSFSSEVTRVAREVGSEGRLGGQAEVEGVYGTWERLTKNVNELAGNLTTQVRAIAEVASAVANGDLSRSISLEAKGEVAELKNNVNLMVANLRETTRAKDWLESNLARIAGLMQGHRNLVEVADLILRELTPLVNAQYGAFFLTDADSLDGSLAFIAGYGAAHDVLPGQGTPGPGLIRQAALERKRILLEDVPPGYIKVHSGLGEAAPASVVVLPIVFEDKVLGVIELASFSRFSDVHLAFFDKFVVTIGVAINTIIANARTEALLSESQRLAQQLQGRSDELQRQQAELRRSNAALEEKAHLLATSSRYKSEFLANMSHELRTPLNSLLILARLLADNPEANLSEQEVEFATTIHNAGSDLLQLINDILDLSKIEAGRMDVRPEKLPLSKLLDYVDATFRPLTVDRGLKLEIEVGPRTPRELYNDERRLQQILRNLLSNAVKFTSAGEVRLAVSVAEDRPDPGGRPMIAFAVSDTGIGIAADKLPAIFGAFQQADGTTSRKYGGTGLGLSISSEIARLLGGEIHASSTPGVGSTFTLYVPASCPASNLAGEPEWAVEQPSPEAAETRAAPPHAEWPAADGEDLWQSAPNLTRLKDGPLAAVFAGRRVLIVDDDIRNVYALTHVLGRLGMEIVYAENGREGIEALERDEEISLVLMDVMMPEMDGYETLAAVREMPRFADLPIIALTAKAMPGDREKTISCGASDYVPKPVDLDQLLEVMRGWLAGEGESDG